VIEKPPTINPVKLALSVPEAAVALSISERSVWGMINSGELPHVRLGEGGGRVLLPVKELTEYLSRKSAAASAGVEQGAANG